MGIKVDGVAPLIQVFDMPRSVAFYRDVLGFEIVTTSPPRGPDDFDWGLLRLEGIDLMLNTAYEADERPPEPDPSSCRCPRRYRAFLRLSGCGCGIRLPSREGRPRQASRHHALRDETASPHGSGRVRDLPPDARLAMSALKLAGVSSAGVALLHVLILFVGGPAYRYFGAGERMARLAERGYPTPALITAGLTALFIVWAAYAFSGAGLLRPLPLLRPALDHHWRRLHPQGIAARAADGVVLLRA